MILAIPQQCVEFLGRGCLDEAKMQEVAKALNEMMDSHFKRQSERHGNN